MKTHDKLFALIAGVAGVAMIITALCVGAWFHIGIGCGLLLIARAYNKESKQI
jgi:hypothetical protein